MKTQEENLKSYQWLIRMTSILAGFSVVNVGMPWEGEYDGEKVRRSE